LHFKIIYADNKLSLFSWLGNDPTHTPFCLLQPAFFFILNLGETFARTVET
jgi:hypothetical protein